MTKRKQNVKPVIPQTKPKEATTKKLTKTQKELFNLHIKTAQEGLQKIGRTLQEEFMKLSNDLMEKDLNGFADELGIDLINETWNFDQRTMQFDKAENEST